FQGCEEIRAATGLPPPDGDLAAILQDRLRFILQSAGRRDNLVRARALLLALETGLAPDTPEISAQAELLLQPEVFREVLAELPARSQGTLCEILRKIHPDRAIALFIAGIAEFDLGSLNEVLRHLEARKDGTTVAARMRGLLQAETPPMEIIAWLCRNPVFRATHGLLADGRLAFSVLTLLENPGMAGVGRTRCRNQLRDSLADPAWLGQACREMNDQQRRDFALRLKNAVPGMGIDNMTLLMRLVKLHPELEDVLAENTPAAAPARLTSLRSYQERQAALHKLVNEDIPNNSRDIGQARSYGDLRENFEYKSAKETQGILMRRRAEFEKLLSEIRATDFENFPTDRAGPGTTVTLQYDNSTEDTFSILGEWDHDEALGIIPLRARLAELLLGRNAGAQVEVPTADGSLRTATITKIDALGPAVKRWIHGQPEEQTDG
ncbi:MAG: GreA/GreB family elongation factor, partial [Lentisphaerae bacterium]|nr:GreA/GreB family elongation factor [Lentisphaerota bacterium]